MKLFYWLVKLAVLAVLLVFAWINTGSVPFFYLPGQSAALPLIVVLFGLFALFGRLVRLRNENARLRAEVQKSARLAAQDLASPVLSETAKK